MRGTLLLVGAGALLLTVAGCTPGTGFTGEGAYTPAPSGSVAGSGTFLAAGSCAARTGVSYHQVACSDPGAVARVTTRRVGGGSGAPDCPATTDFVLTVTGSGAASSPSATPGTRGYACMRNLRAPHPGDPGNGGGPNTIAGDCVYAARPAQAKETACDGSGAHPPEYRIGAVVAVRAQCPAATALYVGVAGDRVGCAVRL